MATKKTLTFHLDAAMRGPAERGDLNIINRIVSAVAQRGVSTEFAGNTEDDFDRDDDFSMFLVEEPARPGALTLRRSYLYPFWRIEHTARRWDWPVAREKFLPAGIDEAKATAFVGYWRKQLFGTDEIPAANADVFVPLQGRLLNRRSFQAASPVDMLRAVLSHSGDKRVIVSLHPNETYSAEETAALNDLVQAHDRLRIVTTNSDRALRNCAYVVTENSGVAFKGLFLHKPCILFARSDFHHIAENVAEGGVDAAFHSVGTRWDFDRYLYWFLQLNAINAGRPDAEDQILSVLKQRGWDL